MKIYTLVQAPPWSVVANLLTSAQSSVAAAMVNGDSTKRIAAMLGKSPKTVSKQVGEVLRAAGCKSSPKFIVWYHECVIAILLSIINDLIAGFRAHVPSHGESPILDRARTV